jgi:hypothetical protein
LTAGQANATLNAPNTTVPWGNMPAGRFSCASGQVSLLTTRGDGLLSTAQSAQLVGVSPATIRSWRHRGWLATQGLDERGHPLHTREAVRAAERQVRENGLRTPVGDPRRLRGRSRVSSAA